MWKCVDCGKEYEKPTDAIGTSCEIEKVQLQFKCPECNEQTIMSSGFNGNPFCWGKCYHYFKWEHIDINTATNKQSTHSDASPSADAGASSEADAKTASEDGERKEGYCNRETELCEEGRMHCKTLYSKCEHWIVPPKPEGKED